VDLIQAKSVIIQVLEKIKADNKIKGRVFKRKNSLTDLEQVVMEKTLGCFQVKIVVVSADPVPSSLSEGITQNSLGASEVENKR
jgi:hypothetical protein